MINRLIKKVDSQRRVNLSEVAIRLSKLIPGEEVAICKGDENSLKVKRIDEIQGEIVLDIRRLDEKARVILSRKLIQDTKEVEILIVDGEVIIKEA